MRIRLASVVKTFEAFRAIRGVSLDIRSGELVALLGPSGSGKTTILRMVAGLEYADGGRIFFGEQDATDIPVRDRGVGFVFQHYALFPHMTVAENIAFGMKAAKLPRPRPVREARVAELLRLMRLDGLGGRFPSQVSGGQRQRVALARALSVDPRVLLLDEPFGALDANVRRDLRRWLRDVHEELGITTLFVTHDQEEALDLADRVVIINNGQIAQEGSPAEVVREPKSAFVMRFLGDTNRFAATVRNDVAEIENGVAVAARGVPNGPADIYARPADLIWRSGDGGAEAGQAARVCRVLDRPSGRRLIVETCGVMAEVDVDPDLEIAPGEHGHIQFLRARVFARTGADEL